MKFPFGNSVSRRRPSCRKCGNRLWLFRVEPIRTAGALLYTFECATCYNVDQYFAPDGNPEIWRYVEKVPRGMAFSEPDSAPSSN